MAHLSRFAVRLSIAVIVVSICPLFAAQVEITNFTKSNNAQTVLQPTYPTGLFMPSNSFGVPFNITSDASNHNYEEISGLNTELQVTGLSIPGVTAVYMLMNAYQPVSGTNIATVEFVGTGGADQTFTLVAGANVRDFCFNVFANTINGTTTQEAFQTPTPVQGGCGSGNVNTGLVRFYLMDEQQFALSSAFLGQTLTQINVTNDQSSSTPILFGITAVNGAGAAAPEPSSCVLILGGGALFAALRRKRMVTRV